MNRFLTALSIFSLLFLSCTSKSDKNQKTNTEIKVSQIAQKPSVNATSEDTSDMVYFPGGEIIIGATMGSNRHQPPFKIEISSFYIDKHPVSVARFAKFVESTGYVTDAEKFGDSGIFDFETGSWDLVKGAYWAYPLGPEKHQADPTHPVTHVSWNDAVAFARWAGKRLPNEFEWEYAAKGGKSETLSFPWGETEKPEGRYMANTWQGASATDPLAEDGYLYTSPLGSFAPSESGLYDMAGNVWEWCSNTFMPYQESTFRFIVDEQVKTIRGGSFMYDQLGTESFSVYGRSYNTVETSLFNTGFRCVK